eukprot:4255373-Alexandrium_andersonii.AAC.1
MQSVAEAGPWTADRGLRRNLDSGSPERGMSFVDWGLRQTRGWGLRIAPKSGFRFADHGGIPDGRLLIVIADCG